MKAHWIVVAAGALLLAGAAGVRSARRAFEAPFAGFEKLVQPNRAPADDLPAAPEFVDEDSTEAEGYHSSSVLGLQPATVLPAHLEVEFSTLIPERLVLEVSFMSDRQVLEETFVEIRDETDSVTEAQRNLLKTWMAWRRGSIDALPKDLQDESDHRRAIDDQFRAAIRGFLTEAVAATYDPLDLDVSIINRPPVGGGYSFEGVGFTDIDEETARQDAQVLADYINSVQAKSRQQEESWSRIAAEVALSQLANRIPAEK